MGATTSRYAISLVAAVGCALLVGGCGGQADTPTASASPSASAVATSPTAVTTSASGPMTGEELVWLEAISTLHKTIDRVVDLPCCVSEAEMRALEDGLRGCTRELAGPPTDRLQPVYELAQKGCAEYDKAAECFATAAEIGAVVAGTAEEREFNDAIDCGFSAPGEGSRLLADAEIKGFEIKEAAG